jgi:hypothetical protein
MKKIIFSIFLSLSVFIMTYGQEMVDVMRIPQTDISGTARYMGMGGAFSALGGDASSIVSNPAGLGIYRGWEITLTPDLYFNYSHSESPNYNLTEGKFNFNINNFSAVGSIIKKDKTKGLIANNFSLSYNRLKNYHRNSSIKLDGSSSSVSDYMAFMTDGIPLSSLNVPLDEAFDGTCPFISDLGWQTGMIDPTNWDDENDTYTSFLNKDELTNKDLYLKEKGSLSEWSFSYSANISNRFYIGATLGIQDFSYSMETEYKEDFENGGYFDLNNTLETSGVGVNLKVGTIIRAFDFMRVGVAVHTPTFFSLKDIYGSNTDASTNEFNGAFRIPGGEADYNVQTPFKLVGGLGFIIGQKAIISVDYEMNDYSKIVKRVNGREDYLVTGDIKDMLKIAHTGRIGAELRVTDIFSLRAGYSITTPYVKESVEKDNKVIYTAGTTPNYVLPKTNSYYTIGFGFRKNIFFLDVAYVLNQRSENLYMHYMSEPVKLNSWASNIACSFGWKF